MNITTKAQAKTITSALRRELKELTKAPGELSHNDCLTIMANALGFPSWNAWESQLVDAPVEKKTEPAPVVSKMKYPLVHSGEFDFISRFEDGRAFAGNFTPLVGTADRLYATGLVTSVGRIEDGPDGKPQLKIAGDRAELDWDSQATRMRPDGYQVWLDDSAGEYSSGQMILAPEDCGDLYEDEDLEVREPLLKAFLTFFDEYPAWAAVAKKGKYSKIEEIIGFSLTEKEQVVLSARLADNAN